jgi:hypothetical protein
MADTVGTWIPTGSCGNTWCPAVGAIWKALETSGSRCWGISLGVVTCPRCIGLCVVSLSLWLSHSLLSSHDEVNNFVPSCLCTIMFYLTTGPQQWGPCNNELKPLSWNKSCLL